MPSQPPPPPDKDEKHQELLDCLDLTSTPRPFRNPQWKPAQRRNKNIKTILVEASRKEASLFATTQTNNSGASTPLPASSDDPSTDGPANIAQAAQNLSTLVLEKNLQVAKQTRREDGKSDIRVGSGVGGGGVMPTYSNIESAPSLHPGHRKLYCDITGLPAPYTDPKSRLRYHNQEVFGVVRGLGQGVAERHLEARGAHVILK